MGKAVSLFFKLRRALNVIPEEYDSELEKEIIDTNLNRLVILSLVLILINLFTVAVDININFSQWNTAQVYRHFMQTHVWIIVERSIFIIAVWLIKVKRLNCSYKLKKIMVLYSFAASLFWCTYSSINAKALYGHSHAMLLGSFFLGSVILALPAESIMIFTVNSVIYILIQHLQNNDGDYFVENIISAVVVFTLIFVVSLVNLSQYIKNYNNRKVIQLQAKELQDSRDRLEEIVRTRTEELVKANEQLIKEMGARHELEMRSIKTRLMYEENTMLLKEIKEYEELRNVFFANLSHELRTPLNVIFSAQQMMDFIISRQNCGDCKNKLIKYNKIVKQNCYRLIRLIGNLIDITKIDAQYFEVVKKNCDIVKLVENITQSVAIYIKDKNIELSFDTEIKERVIACDPDKIERIILNLLSNAVKFTPANGRISVSVRLEPGYVVLSVKDNGIGISQEMQQVVFERFIQADKSMTRKREGSGIGLSLVKSLVDLHQGKISLFSEPGKGSEFVVKIPDISIPFEECAVCTADDDMQNIERINIEFSDIYS